jgi:hypothetical protein
MGQSLCLPRSGNRRAYVFYARNHAYTFAVWTQLPLLDLPLDGPVAASSIYYLPQPCWTSALQLLVRPSAAAWNRVSWHFPSAADRRVYDMVIVNGEFGSEMCTLPAGVFYLNSEWEDADRPTFSVTSSIPIPTSRSSISTLGKPWFCSVEKVRRLRPNPHPVFYELANLAEDEIFAPQLRGAANR